MKTAISLYMLAVVFAGCQPSQGTHTSSASQDAPGRGALLDGPTVNGLALALIPTSHEPKIGDSLVVAVLLRNDGPARPVSIDPSSFEVEVLNAQGTRVSPVDRVAVNASLGDASTILLPSGGVIGYRLNLSCQRAGSGVPSQVACLSRIPIRDAGEYQLVARYRSPATTFKNWAAAATQVESSPVRLKYIAR